MHIRRFALPLLAIAVFQGAARAQDWADDLTDKPRILDIKFTPKNPKHLTLTEAQAIINNTLQLQDAPAKAYVEDPNFYCLIHLVNWKADVADIDSNAWFVFRGGKSWNAINLEGNRMYGNRHVAVLYVHLVQAVEEPDLATLKPADRDDFQKGRFSNFKDAKGGRNTFKRIDGTLYVDGYPPTIDLDYRIEVTKKTIAPFQHLATLLTAAANSLEGTKVTLQNKTVLIWAGRYYDTQYKTSDVLVKPQAGVDTKDIGKKTFDNEGNYYFDFSAGIPVRGVKQLQFDSTNNTATPKTVTTTNVYGLLNLFAKPVDVKTDYSVWPPSFVAGVGLTGRPLDKPLIGLGFGYGKLNGFVGCLFNKVTQPGATPGSTISHREDKFVFGLNITARQVADLLKKK